MRQSARITFENEVYGSKTNKKLQEKINIEERIVEGSPECYNKNEGISLTFFFFNGYRLIHSKNFKGKKGFPPLFFDIKKKTQHVYKCVN